MRRDSRPSGVLHALLRMAEQPGPITSEALARAMNTNPVVIRRIFGGLRDRDHVRSEKGPGGGWTIACDLAAVTRREIYDVLSRPERLAMGNRTEAPGRLVEQAVDATLGVTFDEAEALLLRRFGEISLAALSADVHTRPAERGGSPALETNHAA